MVSLSGKKADNGPRFVVDQNLLLANPCPLGAPPSDATQEPRARFPGCKGPLWRSLRRLPGVDSWVRRSPRWEGRGGVLGISTILHASAVQIKCKLKPSAPALSKGDANLLLISLLCHAGTVGLLGAVVGAGGRQCGEERGRVLVSCGLECRPSCLVCAGGMAFPRRADGGAFTLVSFLHFEMREVWKKGDAGLSGLRFRSPWG